MAPPKILPPGKMQVNLLLPSLIRIFGGVTPLLGGGPFCRTESSPVLALFFLFCTFALFTEINT
ncbi:MAG: hypothetical protein EGP78_03400 [Alistipes shahii]|nr:hypothetical protein [Alistipes shahii]